MTATIPLPFDRAPLTANGLRRMHFQAEARAKRIVKQLAVIAIRAAKVQPMPCAEVVR